MRQRVKREERINRKKNESERKCKKNVCVTKKKIEANNVRERETETERETERELQLTSSSRSRCGPSSMYADNVGSFPSPGLVALPSVKRLVGNRKNGSMSFLRSVTCCVTQQGTEFEVGSKRDGDRVI